MKLLNLESLRWENANNYCKSMPYTSIHTFPNYLLFQENLNISGLVGYYTRQVFEE
jgi:hypothetical protein